MFSFKKIPYIFIQDVFLGKIINKFTMNVINSFKKSECN